MRLGVSTSFSFRDAEDWITKHVSLGLRSVVFPFSCEEDPKVSHEFARWAKANDITIAEVGVWRNTLDSDMEKRSANVEYAIGQLMLAEKIGAKCCVNVAGTPHGDRWDGGYAANFSDETRREIIKTVRFIIDEVKPKKTKFTLEPMPWMVPAGPDDYLRLLEEVERDEFAVHFDFINMINSAERFFHMNDFMDECFEKLGKYTVSCHLKDIKLLPDYTFCVKETKCGDGAMDIKRFIYKANKIDPDMPVIIEHLDTDKEYFESVQYVFSLLSKKRSSALNS